VARPVGAAQRPRAPAAGGEEGGSWSGAVTLHGAGPVTEGRSAAGTGWRRRPAEAGAGGAGRRIRRPAPQVPTA